MVSKDNEREWPASITEGHSPPLRLVSLQAEAGPLVLQVVLDAKYRLRAWGCPSVWPRLSDKMTCGQAAQKRR